MKDMVIEKFPPVKLPRGRLHQQIPSWVRVRGWVGVRAGNNLPRGNCPGTEGIYVSLFSKRCKSFHLNIVLL